MSKISSVSIWGDSILRGVIFDAAASKYRLLKDSAVALFTKNFPVFIKNNARFGCTAPRALPMIQKAMDSGESADLVLFEFGGNDCDYRWDEVSLDPDADHQPNTPIEEFSDTLYQMVLAVQTSGRYPIMMSLPPIDATRYFDFITSPANVDPARVLTFLTDKEHIYRHQERYSNAVCRVAANRNIPLIDVREKFLTQKNLCDFLCLDGIHPNEKGQGLINAVFSEQYEIFKQKIRA